MNVENYGDLEQKLNKKDSKSTNNISLVYYLIMTELIETTSRISDFTAILWCFYPIAILVLVELLLGGGFDDDNDDQDGGMLIPAYSSSQN